MAGQAFDPIVRLFWEGACSDNWREGPRRIYDCLLEYVSDGEYKLILGGTHHIFKAGSVFIVPPGIRSEALLTKRRFVFRHCVHFSWNSDFIERKPPIQTHAEEPFRTELSHPVPAAIGKLLPLSTDTDASSFLAIQMRALLTALRENQDYANLLLWPVLRRLLSVHEKPAVTAPVSMAARAALDVKSFIDAHYFEEISYRDFCELTGMSQSYLCEIFHDIVGSPPAMYLNDVRLQHARRLLREEKLSIKQIARTVGVRDANYFVRLFRKRFGETPTAYKAGCG
jgi:AraC-like DNA-binding protein